MAKKRRKFSSNFKAKVALEALKGHKTLSELAQQFDLHPNQIVSWKKQLLEVAPEAFSRKRSQEKGATEKKEAELYEQIGRLQMQLAWLKKKIEQLESP